MNYSLYQKKRSQIFVVGVERRIKQFLKSLYLYLLANKYRYRDFKKCLIFFQLQPQKSESVFSDIDCNSL